MGWVEAIKIKTLYFKIKVVSWAKVSIQQKIVRNEEKISNSLIIIKAKNNIIKKDQIEIRVIIVKNKYNFNVNLGRTE